MPIAYSPFNESLWKDPWPTYKKMRESDPVYYIEEFDAWALSRFEDIWQVSMEKTRFTATQGTSPEALLLDPATPPKTFLFMDPPQHRKHRNLIGDRYTPAAVATLEDKIRATTRQALQPHLQQGSLNVNALVSAVALQTIANYIGLEFDEIIYIRRLIDTYYTREPGHKGTTANGMRAFQEASTFIHQLIAKYRQQPAAQGSHIHAWMQSAIDDARMTDDEIFFSIFALVITGSDTLPLTVAATLYYLSLDDANLGAVRDDNTLIPNAFAEAARIDQPTNILGRVLSEDVEMHGKTMKQGQPVLFLYASANRDEREFDAPEQFQLHRKSRRSLSFGAGQHFCLGQHLARLEGRVILEELFTQLGDFSVQRDQSKRIFGEFLQGFCYLPITFKPLP
ncbi:MAG: hypothetical protein CME39_10290 [Haliea sp.]|nr:hypothetical protein [Haliea sp.]